MHATCSAVARCSLFALPSVTFVAEAEAEGCGGQDLRHEEQKGYRPAVLVLGSFVGYFYWAIHFTTRLHLPRRYHSAHRVFRMLMHVTGRQGSAVCRAHRAPGIARSGCCHLLLHILFLSHTSNIFNAVRLLIPCAQLIFGYNFARLTPILLLFAEAPTRMSAGAPSRRKRNTTGELLRPAVIVIVVVSILFHTRSL